MWKTENIFFYCWFFGKFIRFAIYFSKLHPFLLTLFCTAGRLKVLFMNVFVPRMKDPWNRFTSTAFYFAIYPGRKFWGEKSKEIHVLVNIILVTFDVSGLYPIMDRKEILELWLTIWKQETMLLESNGKLVGFTLMENSELDNKFYHWKLRNESY